MSQVAEKFSCASCQRSYTWKKEIAGKRVKCKCGTPLTVPAQISKPKPPPSDPAEDDLYALADFAAAERQSADAAEPVIVQTPPPQAAPKRSAAPSASSSRPAGAGGAAAAAAIPLGYRRAPTGREIANANVVIDMRRDFHVPIALLIVGTLLYLSYYGIHYGLGPGGLIATSIGLGIMTVFETAILVGFAVTVAGPLGVSFGGVGTAILKLAAIALLCDGITTWVDGIVGKYSGGASSNIFGFGAIGWPVALGVYWTCFIYLFSMDPGDSWFVVVILSVFYRIIRVVLLLLLLKLILGFGGVGGAAIALPAMGPAASPNPVVDEFNDAMDHGLLIEAKKYCISVGRTLEIPTIEGFYAAGAKNVWMEVERDFSGQTRAFRIVVELPPSKEIRAKLVDVANAYCDTYKQDHVAMGPMEDKDPYLFLYLPRQ